jgi:hypothetical protein
MLNFPRGRYGVGLLVARFAATTLVLTITVNQLSSGNAAPLSFSAAVLAVFIALGLFVPVSSCLAGSLMVILYFLCHDVTMLTIGTIVLLCISLSMTGGGAYSLDALIFGQRRVTFSSR